MDVWMDRRMCGWQRVRWMCGWIDGCVDGRVDVCMDG